MVRVEPAGAVGGAGLSESAVALLREAGVEVLREAATHDVAGLLAAIGSAACSSAS
jgi:hypothetical protein